MTFRRCARPIVAMLALSTVGWVQAAWGGSAIVPGAEGQVGTTPGADETIVGPAWESIRGAPREILLADIEIAELGLPPPPPEVAVLRHSFHDDSVPVVVETVEVSFDDVSDLPPASARARNAADDGDLVAFAFATDGSSPDTLAARLVTFDEGGSKLADVTIDDLETFTGFGTPAPEVAGLGLGVDNQGRATVAYVEFEMGAPKIRAGRFNGATGAPIDFDLAINDLGVSPDLAVLDLLGERVLVVSVDAGDPDAVQGNVIDFSGAVPVVLPEFPISTTPGIANVRPAVAADPATGAFVVAWENVVGLPGDPVNVRARRFDTMDDPVGPDFIVNSTTDDAQGQVSLDFGPNGELVIVWAGDPLPLGDGLEVFAQAYDAAGSPIAGEIRVNTDTTDDQDQPKVRFLPEADAQGRSQFAVVWRDVEVAFDGKPARGTGRSYRCFSVDELPAEIFTDGFESGDTTSWSTTVP